jgi:hypothetical protein
LYSSFHLNFVEPLPRAVLEEFAAAVARDGTEELVGGVLDQYLSFIAPSPALFSLLPAPPAVPKPGASTAPTGTAPTPTPQVRTSYSILNSPGSGEQDIEEEIERIAAGLFSVIATSGLPLSITPNLY